MTVDPNIIRKAKDKSLYKVRGVLVNYQMPTDKLIEFIIRKGTGDKEKFYALKTFNEAIIKTIMNSSPKARYAVKFKVESKPYNGKWYTNLWAHEVEVWKVGADAEARAIKNEAIRLAEEKRVQEHVIEKGSNLRLFGNDDWGLNNNDNKC